MMLLLTIFVFFYGFSTGQNLSSPVKKLLDRATELNKGDLKTRVYLETKDEMSDLAKIFNEIAEKLEKSYANEETTEKSVDIKVRAKTQALEETINALEQKIKNRTIELQKIADESKKIQEIAKIKEMETEELKRQISTLRSAAEKHGSRTKTNGEA